ncbi:MULTISPECIES: copper ion binding protein [Paenibacillus]|uniref:Heavy-metal-associated domain-containing protein n=2 Tax=Paenibacillus TaxID=44249 RepID=A0A5J5GFE2_9BACL|nr:MULTISPECIES: copper ion binding protein [Paenibacillus]KAA9006184.1 heavy-metal-associated domain-containing protein [Paenibacillus spiritus]SDJ05480.1 copper chaperone [Paenibacillus typhae]
MKNETLHVEGMSCGHCVKSVEGAVKNIGADAKVNLEQKTVEVSFDESVSLEAIKNAIEEQGYDVV